MTQYEITMMTDGTTNSRQKTATTNTIGQADELRRLDCLEAQGFLFAPGLPHAQASALLQAGFVTAAGVHAVRS